MRALVVTAAAALVLGSASSALASTSGADARPSHLVAEASWHGRAIERPDSSRIELQQPAGSLVIRQGAGYARAGGSRAVREIQRRLVALGYRPGPIDGAFGPRTRSAVAWFQIKHRLSPTGAVDGETFNLLRYRTHGLRAAAAPSKQPALSLGAAPAGGAKHAPTRAVLPDAAAAPKSHHGGSPNFIVWILAVVAFQLVILALIRNWPLIEPHLPDRGRRAAYRTWLRQRMARLGGRMKRLLDAVLGLGKRIRSLVAKLRARMRKPDKPVRLAAGVVPRHWRSSPSQRAGELSAGPSGPPPAATPIAASAAVTAPSSGPPRAIGYAVGRSSDEFARQQRAMERICGERGWMLAALVKEPVGHQSKPQRRAGLTHVLRQVGSGAVAQLIVGRLHSVARSPAELAVILDWCSRHDTGLVALDVGLDTTTPSGRLAASRLGAIGARPAANQPGARHANGDGHANGNGVANGKGHANGDGHGRRHGDGVATAGHAPTNGNGRANGNGRPAQAVKTFGYASVQHDTNDATRELEAQRRVIERKCRQCGYDLVEFGREREPKDGNALERPSLSSLLGRIAAGEATCLVVTGLDRLSRSIVELSSLLRWFEQNGVRLVVVELDLDTATADGLTTTRSLAAIGRWEREHVSEPTRRGVAAPRGHTGTNGRAGNSGARPASGVG